MDKDNRDSNVVEEYDGIGDGAQFARSYLRQLRQNPASVCLAGYLDDLWGFTKDDTDANRALRNAFADEIAAALGQAPRGESDEGEALLKPVVLNGVEQKLHAAAAIADALATLDANKGTNHLCDDSLCDCLTHIKALIGEAQQALEGVGTQPSPAGN